MNAVIFILRWFVVLGRLIRIWSLHRATMNDGCTIRHGPRNGLCHQETARECPECGFRTSAPRHPTIGAAALHGARFTREDLETRRAHDAFTKTQRRQRGHPSIKSLALSREWPVAAL